jgi:hypothetical protein
LLVKPRSTDLSCGEATLRTSPSSGQAAITCQLRHPYLLACHSRAALGSTNERRCAPSCRARQPAVALSIHYRL